MMWPWRRCHASMTCGVNTRPLVSHRRGADSAAGAQRSVRHHTLEFRARPRHPTACAITPFSLERGRAIRRRAPSRP
eukprot:366021-Chlamydomonas_euryale.AAC.2